MAKHCRFCANPAGSKEHAWPAWLMRFMGQMDSSITHIVRGPDEPELAVKTSPTVKSVCESCNNGWMHQVEATSAPMLKRMIACESVAIGEEVASAIATWTTKTAMVFDTTRAEGRRNFGDEECEYIRKHSLPPSGVLVWLACLSKPIRPYTEGWSLLTKITEQSQCLEGGSTTFGFGYLVLQILTVRLRFADQSTGRAFIDDGFRSAGPSAVELWPGRVHPVIWPPRQRIESLSQLDEFSRRFGPTESDRSSEQD